MKILLYGEIIWVQNFHAGRQQITSFQKNLLYHVNNFVSPAADEKKHTMCLSHIRCLNNHDKNFNNNAQADVLLAMLVEITLVYSLTSLINTTIYS